MNDRSFSSVLRARKDGQTSRADKLSLIGTHHPSPVIVRSSCGHSVTKSINWCNIPTISAVSRSHSCARIGATNDFLFAPPLHGAANRELLLGGLLSTPAVGVLCQWLSHRRHF